ncbi:MAG TPA: hypothetical protein VGN13_05470 [Solirubrobacteraceae bacterium]|jgi:hypothetical protein
MPRINGPALKQAQRFTRDVLRQELSEWEDDWHLEMQADAEASERAERDADDA